MRLVALGLDRYGIFRDKRIPLGPGLTVVLGRNEAGKSTALSALADMICGLPMRHPLAELAPRAEQRLSLEVQDLASEGTAVGSKSRPAPRPRLAPGESNRGRRSDNGRRPDSRQRSDDGQRADSLVPTSGNPETAEGQPRSGTRIPTPGSPQGANGRRRSGTLVRTGHGLNWDDDPQPIPNPWHTEGKDERQLWLTRFGLDHESLRRGGLQVADGSGDLAELVYTARQGVGLRELLERLDSEADKLFVDRRSSKVLIRLELKRYKEALAEQRQAVVRSADVLLADNRVHDLAEQLATAGEVEAAARRHQQDVDEKTWCLADAHRLHDVRRNLKAVLDGVLLDEDELAQYELFAPVSEKSGARVGNLKAEIARLTGEREVLVVNETLLAAGDEIGELHELAAARVNDRARAAELRHSAEGYERDTRDQLELVTGRPVVGDLKGNLVEVTVPVETAARLDVSAERGPLLTTAVADARDSLDVEHKAHEDLPPVEDLPERAAIAPLIEALQVLRATDSPLVQARAAHHDGAAARDRCRRALLEVGIGQPEPSTLAMPSTTSPSPGDQTPSASPGTTPPSPPPDTTPPSPATTAPSPPSPSPGSTPTSPSPAPTGPTSVPVAPPAERLRDEIANLDAARRMHQGVTERLKRAVQKCSTAQQQLRWAESGGAVDVADLTEARSERESLWQYIRIAWIDGLLLGGTPGELAGNYEIAVETADATADNLLEQADAVAHLSQLKQDAAQAVSALTAVQGEDRQASQVLADRESAWTQLWANLGVTAPPTTRADGYRVHLVAAGKAQSDASLADEVAAGFLEEVTGWSARLRDDLARAGRECPATALDQDDGQAIATLDALLAAASTLVSDVDGAREARQRRNALGRRIVSAQAKLDQAEELVAAWARDWQHLVESSGLPAELDPPGWQARRRCVDAARASFSAAGELRRQADDLQQNWDEFADRVRAVAAKDGERAGITDRQSGVAGTGERTDVAGVEAQPTVAGIDPPADVASVGTGIVTAGNGGRAGVAGANTSVASAIASATGTGDAVLHVVPTLKRLWDGLQRSLIDSKQRIDRVHEIGRKNAAYQQESARLNEARQHLERLEHKYALADDSSLAGAAAARREAQQIEAEERKLLGLLAAAVGPFRDLQVLTDELATLDLPELEVAKSLAITRVATAEEGANQLAKELGAAEQELHRLTRTGDAATKRALAEERLAQVALLTERYAVLHLQRRLLRDQLEAYADRHGSPLLEHAGRLLEQLTAARWVALQATEDDAGQRAFRVVRRDGVPLSLGDLSEGTADQVFLALRLAGISQLQAERRAQGELPLPVVLDDVLVSFDDERALTALRLIAALANPAEGSEGAQTILFTHHEHVAALAESLAGEGVSLVRLDPVPSMPNGQRSAGFAPSRGQRHAVKAPPNDRGSVAPPRASPSPTPW